MVPGAGNETVMLEDPESFGALGLEASWGIISCPD
jgi:hypothetical protein